MSVETGLPPQVMQSQLHGWFEDKARLLASAAVRGTSTTSPREQEIDQLRVVADRLLEIPHFLSQLRDEVIGEWRIFSPAELEETAALFRKHCDDCLGILALCTEMIQSREARGWPIGRGAQLEKVADEVRQFRDRILKFLARPERPPVDMAMVAASYAAIARGEVIDLGDLLNSLKSGASLGDS